ncbi:hypothetical protein [Devosia sp. FKR38]|uniref:hypothetical protein n=1 Tax=Devosia sp. FKR38 TaxID=2562312 RepID=UPI00197B03DE|nr:hypothetical protein [Devosia sp. FKR38]
MPIKTTDVFGLRTTVSEHSYVDRGKLDKALLDLSQQNQHIALKGESKSGKSWLRQRIFQDAVVVQCRVHHLMPDIYTQILAKLDIKIAVQQSSGFGGSMTLEGTAEAGWKWLAKATVTAGGAASADISTEKVTRSVGRNELDIEFIADVIKASGKRIVIEDFHYLSHPVREVFAHELKTLWDYGVYVIIVGIWHRKNYLTFLNGDLALRLTEVNVGWTVEELAKSFQKGCAALNVDVPRAIIERAAKDSYSNIGILQSIALGFLTASGIQEEQEVAPTLADSVKLDDAGMQYADQLAAVYANFAERVSEGIRKRKDATQIYAFALWSIMESPDNEAMQGLSVDWIFQKSHARQPRIQKPNLRKVLRKFYSLQVDDKGKGLVIAFDEGSDVVIIIDKGLLFYRKYRTEPWPWERIAEEAKERDEGLIGEDD